MVKKFLRIPTEPIEVWPDKKISDLTKEMLLIGFQGRKLAEAVEIWAKMIRRKNMVIWFGLSGAMIPAGMRRIVSYLVERRMIDAIVSTGANLYHDAVEALGARHYVGTHRVDDVKLRKQRVDRIYDVYADEDRYYKIDHFIMAEFAMQHLKDNYPYSSREVLYNFGKFLNKNARDKHSILINAYKNKIPVFSPALGDSSLGFSFMFATRPLPGGRRVKVVSRAGKKIVLRSKKIVIDMMKDVDESSLITEKAKATGVIYVGGGTPKNYINQTAVISSYQTRHSKSHDFAIQITTDSPQWGGLSGCTFDEAKSWGKFKPNARIATCYCDATIALPIIVHALSEKFKRLRRNVPIFKWNNGKLKIEYEKTSL